MTKTNSILRQSLWALLTNISAAKGQEWIEGGGLDPGQHHVQASYLSAASSGMATPEGDLWPRNQGHWVSSSASNYWVTSVTPQPQFLHLSKRGESRSSLRAFVLRAGDRPGTLMPSSTESPARRVWGTLGRLLDFSLLSFRKCWMRMELVSVS